MLAAKLYGPGDIRLMQCEIPKIGEEEVLLKTAVTAVCGTDLRMIRNGAAGVDDQHPLVPGHEISGTIARVGSRVKGYREGMRAAVAPNMGCGTCGHCISGNTHLCRDYQALGIQMDGGFAEYVRIPAPAVRQGNLFILDDSVPFQTAAMFEPASCVMNGQEQIQVGLNDQVLIIGAGPIGILHGLIAKARGAAGVWIRDLSEERMRQCVKPAPFLRPLPGEHLKEAVMEATGGKGMDVCIVACPSAEAQAEALELMNMNGRILYFGGLPGGRDQVTLSTNLIHYRQLKICGSARGNLRHYREVAAMAAAGMLDLQNIVTDEFLLSDFQEAIAHAAKGSGLKTVITFDI